MPEILEALTPDEQLAPKVNAGIAMLSKGDARCSDVPEPPNATKHRT
jgi:hypothetical protein